MSRPKDLPVGTQSWATGTYAAGPAWGGTAQRSAPAGTALVPGVSLAAEVANYLYGNAFDGAQGAINCAGQIPALNWFGGVSVGSNNPFASIAWSDVDQTWLAIRSDASAEVWATQDYGRGWGNALTSLASASASADIAFDTSGNFVVSPGGSGTNTQSGAHTAYAAWTVTNSAAVLTTATTNSQVVYEPVNALWCILLARNASANFGYTSGNRTAWTSRTMPATWQSLAVSGWVTLGVGNGLVVGAFVDSTTTFRTMRSSDGGITWTNDQAITVNAGITLVPASTALNGQGISRPVYSSVDGLWYITAFQTGTKKTQVFSSPDAITWTSATTLLANDVAMVSVASLGALLVGVNSDGRVYSSINKGVNWFFCGVAPGSVTSTLLRSGGNGLLFLSKNGTQFAATPSARFGLPATAA